MCWLLQQNAKASLSAVNILLIKHSYLEWLALICHAVQRTCDLKLFSPLSSRVRRTLWINGEMAKGRSGERGCCQNKLPWTSHFKSQYCCSSPSFCGTLPSLALRNPPEARWGLSKKGKLLLALYVSGLLLCDTGPWVISAVRVKFPFCLWGCNTSRSRWTVVGNEQERCMVLTWVNAKAVMVQLSFCLIPPWKCSRQAGHFKCL